MTDIIRRYLTPIFPDPAFGRQMRFIAGPRQVGKTTMVKAFLKEKQCEKLYYNWDVKDIRSRYRKNPEFFMENIYSLKHVDSQNIWICFDEIHKVKNWKNILKEHFDIHEKEFHTIVTGSARLDLFRKAGDSLAGRYFLFHMFPLTLGEILNQPAPIFLADAATYIEMQLSRKEYPVKQSEEFHNLLLKFSGFPEPLIQANNEFHRIWQRNYLERIVYEDLREISQIQDLDKTAQLLEFIPDCIGSPLSINALREDLEINFATAKKYLKYLELAYVLFFVKPYYKKIRNAVKKESKVYFYDWTKAATPGACFENYVACELLALTHLWNDSGKAQMGLHFVKLKGKKEIDFLITHDQKPWLLVEAKLGEDEISASHSHMASQFEGIPFVQIIQKPGIAKRYPNNLYVISAQFFF
jgi:predicted AAA+ superfamily ATPase